MRATYAIREFINTREEWHYFWLGVFLGYLARDLVQKLVLE